MLLLVITFDRFFIQAIPYEARGISEALSSRFSVTGIPSLIVLDAGALSHLSSSAHKIFTQYPIFFLPPPSYFRSF